MKSTGLFATAFTALLGALPLTTARAAPLQPGQILLDDFNGAIRQYSAAGTLLQTSTGADIQWSGLAVTPTGNIVTASRGHASLKVFSPTGTQIANVTDGVPSNPFDVSVFADGTIALSNGTTTVSRYTVAGSLIGTTTVTGVSATGSTVGSDNVLYFADHDNKDFGMMNAAGTFLGTVPLSFFPADLVMSPLDGTLWLTDLNSDTIHHYTKAGVSLGSFADGFSSSNSYGIGIAPDGGSLYSIATSGTTVRHLSLTGVLLDTFTVPTGNFSIVVVTIPEPGSAVFLGVGALSLLARRRRGSPPSPLATRHSLEAPGSSEGA